MKWVGTEDGGFDARVRRELGVIVISDAQRSQREEGSNRDGPRTRSTGVGLRQMVCPACPPRKFQAAEASGKGDEDGDG